MANTTSHARRLSFQASWRTDRGEQSFAQVIGPSGVLPAHMVVYVGGHDGVRVAIRDADAAEALAWLFAEAAARFRTARATPKADDSPGLWDEQTFTAPPPDPDPDDPSRVSQGNANRTTQPEKENPK